MNNGCFLPEILEEIFQYFHRGDLHACLFVNRPFYAQAIHFLYRSVSFLPNWVNERYRIKEDKMWTQLYRTPRLASHIRRLSIDFTTPDRPPLEKMVPPFEERLARVVSHANGLKHVKLSCRRWDSSQQHLDSVLTALCTSKSSPELSLDLVYLGMGKHVLMLDEILHGTYFIMIPQIQDTLPITSITLHGLFYLRRLQYVSQFRQLRTLRLLMNNPNTQHFDGPIELEPIFRHLPLMHLEIGTHGFKGVIKSFPCNLQTLVIETSTLDSTTWAAVCTLQHLRHLELDYSETEQSEVPLCEFKSTTLKSLRVDADLDIHLHRILPPIYTSCSFFSHFSIELWDTPLSPSLMSTFFSSQASLSRITIASDFSNPYTFHDLVNGVKNLPNLKNLHIPWPATVGYLGVSKGVSSTPQRLSFRDCTNLAVACPKLDEIKFQFDDDRICSQYRYSLWDDVHRLPMPLDSKRLGDWWVSHQTLLQSFKMAKFIDDSSPCLNLVTVFFHFEDEDNIFETANCYKEEIVIFLPMKQIRRHVDHMYKI